MFFFFAGSQNQFYAEKELKQRGWRFHKRYQTWFRRTGNPQTQTDQFEIADFEYFDHNSEHGWWVRKRPYIHEVTQKFGSRNLNY
jgi:CCR4-NOT transcription complex subunit 3